MEATSKSASCGLLNTRPVKKRGVAVMNSRRSAGMATASSTVAKSDETRPAQRWASSAITRLKPGTCPSR